MLESLTRQASVFRLSRLLRFASLLGIATGAIGTTCVVVEEGPPGAWDGPGENVEVMEEQEEEIVDETNR
jgi:hypothetical protein